MAGVLCAAAAEIAIKNRQTAPARKIFRKPDFIFVGIILHGNGFYGDLEPWKTLAVRVAGASGAGIELDGREADGFGLVIDAQEHRCFTAVDINAHHDSISHGFSNDDLMGLDDPIVT